MCRLQGQPPSEAAAALADGAQPNGPHQTQSPLQQSPFRNGTSIAQARWQPPGSPPDTSGAQQHVSSASPTLSSPHMSAVASHFSPSSSMELGSGMPLSRRRRVATCAAMQIAVALRPQPMAGMQLPGLGTHVHVLSQIDDSTSALARVLSGKGLPSPRQAGRQLHTALTVGSAANPLAEVLRSSKSAPWQSAGGSLVGVARAGQARKLGSPLSSPQQVCSVSNSDPCLLRLWNHQCHYPEHCLLSNTNSALASMTVQQS